jgi:glycosyltransferase involved in cell wall biosynthesis
VSDRPDVLLLSLGTTLGWRVADRLFLEQLERAGLSTAAVSVRFGAAGRLRRAYPVNDLVEALSARRALRSALRSRCPGALVISTTTAAMLAQTGSLPYAVRLDAPACLNRAGPQNAGLHALERRALSRAALVLPWSQAALSALPAGSAPAVVVPPAVERSAEPVWKRERLAVAYTPDVKAKGLDIVCAAWAAAALEDARLQIFGVERDVAMAYLKRMQTPVAEGVDFAGWRPAAEFRSALRHARAYAGGARWEDFGQAPLEALADGALLATVPSGGPFEALPLALDLDPRLVAPSLDPAGLAAALRAAFELPDREMRAYRERAANLLERFRSEAIQRVVEREVVPVLLSRRGGPR